MSINERQKRFADNYIIEPNAFKAAIDAGYSEKYAKAQSHRLLENVGIRQYMDERLQEMNSEKVADQEEVMEYLTKVLRGEETDQTVVFQGADYGSSIEDIQVANKDRIRAAELLGKRYGMWTDKIDLDGNVDLKVVVDYGDGEPPDDS